MEAMRTRLPRWARGTRLKARSAPKPAAPPSLATLIKQDDRWALQQRICATPSALMEVNDADDFFGTQWPKLLKMACHHLSDQSIQLLIMIRPRGTRQSPPVPPQAFSWLLEGLEKTGTEDRLLMDGRPGVSALLERLSHGPLTLRKADGMRLMRLGGALTLFSDPQDDGPQSRCFWKKPVFIQAWKKWCAVTAHINEALAFIDHSHEWSRRPWTQTRPITEFLTHLPANRHDQVKERICQGMLNQGIAREFGYFDVARMIWWFQEFETMGWKTDHPVWETWAQSFMKSLGGDDPRSRELAEKWFKAFLGYNRNKDDVPAWAWNEPMEKAALTALAQDLRQIIDHQTPTEANWEQAAERMEDLLDLEKRLVRLELTGNDSRAWDETLEQVLGKEWEQSIDAALALHEGQPGTRAFHAWWVKWKHNRMEHRLQPSGAPRAPKPRF